MLTTMTQPRVHMRLIDTTNGRSHTLCGVSSLTWTRDPSAVTCPACINKMEAQPA